MGKTTPWRIDDRCLLAGEPGHDARYWIPIDDQIAYTRKECGGEVYGWPAHVCAKAWTDWPDFIAHWLEATAIAGLMVDRTILANTLRVCALRQREREAYRSAERELFPVAADGHAEVLTFAQIATVRARANEILVRSGTDATL